MWILADEGHGPDWLRVFGSVDRETVWPAFAASALSAPVVGIRVLAGYGVACRVELSLTVNARTAPIRSVWHYADADADAAPRLVTAFPTA